MSTFPIDAASITTDRPPSESRTILTAVTLADGTELVGMVTRVRAIWQGQGEGEAFPHRSIEFSSVRVGGETIQIHISGEGPNLAYSDIAIGDEFVLTLVPRK